MRVLVTRGAGFIGSAVCHALVKRGAGGERSSELCHPGKRSPNLPERAVDPLSGRTRVGAGGGASMKGIVLRTHSTCSV